MRIRDDKKKEKIIEGDSSSNDSNSPQEGKDDKKLQNPSKFENIAKERFEAEYILNELESKNAENFKIEKEKANDLQKAELKKKFELIQTLIVTGAAGYLGSHLVQKALEGNYKVIAGVHIKSRKQKCEHLNTLKKKWGTKLEIIKFSMQNLKEIQYLLKKGDCVIHCATLNRQQTEINSINVLYPEIEGILNLLTTCEKFSIKRFILIGCISNVITGKYKKTYNEKHWADPNLCDMYERAKFFVEKTAWKFLDHQNDVLKLTVFLPGLLIGPVVKNCDSSPNVVFFRKLIDEDIDKLIKIKIPVVDVRDLVSVILNSIKNEGSFNQRYIINEEVYWINEIVKNFKNKSGELKENKISFVSKVLMKFLSFFDRDLKKIINFSGKNYKVNNDKSKKELKISYRPNSESMKDMKESFEKFGFYKTQPIQRNSIIKGKE